MLKPLFIENLSWRMAEVYEAVTDRILINLARYFPYVYADNEMRGSFEWQSRMLAQMGQVNSETVTIIMGSLKGEDEALREVLEATIMEALKHEEPALREAARRGLLNPPNTIVPELSPNQMQAFAAYYRQSVDKLNLVNTTMLQSTAAIYQQTVSDTAAKISRTQGILNSATGEVVTGVSSWNSAMHSAVAGMVETGITGFYDSAMHHWRPETYVANVLRTTLSNTAREAVWERNEEWGNDIYQVSSHAGARPMCYPWQCKLLSRTNYSRDVTDLNGNTIHVHSQDEVESLEYGGGLFGNNCKHYPMAFVPSLSVIRGEPQPQEENDRLYEETQHQRGLEREVRRRKLDLATAKAQGAPAEETDYLKSKVDQARSNLADYCAEHDLPRRKQREYTPIKAEWPDV